MIRKALYLSRTAAGLRHLNRIVVRPSVEIFFDIGPHPDGLQDSFQLISEDGIYNRVLKRNDAGSHSDKLEVLRFQDVFPGRKYSLRHYVAEGAGVVVFADVPFASIQQHGQATAPPPARKTRKRPPEAPPQHVSGDPVMRDEGADRPTLADYIARVQQGRKDVC
jgi:hypothetical protein